MGWLWKDPPHVRLHVLHEGTDSGDMTIEGWQVATRGGFVWLDRATLLEGDGRRTTLAGRVEVPIGRVLLREHLVAVSSPLLDLAPVGFGE